MGIASQCRLWQKPAAPDFNRYTRRSNIINTKELRKAASAVYLATDEAVAKDLSAKLSSAAQAIDDLKDLVIWMTGCGYDFCQHDYFCKQRDKLLKHHSDGDSQCDCPHYYNSDRCGYFEKGLCKHPRR